MSGKKKKKKKKKEGETYICRKSVIRYCVTDSLPYSFINNN